MYKLHHKIKQRKGEQIIEHVVVGNGCVIFEFNDKSLHTKNNSEWRCCVSLGYFILYIDNDIFVTIIHKTY